MLELFGQVAILIGSRAGKVGREPNAASHHKLQHFGQFSLSDRKVQRVDAAPSFDTVFSYDFHGLTIRNADLNIMQNN